MAHEHNPHQKEMADESMVRNLAAQIEAIWPQEKPIYRTHPLPAKPRILDVGCGTGEVEPHLLEVFPDAEIVGVDLDAAHLERARRRCAGREQQVRFEVGDAMELKFPDASFDLVVSRHVVQALPSAEKAIAEWRRVARPGGRLHVIAEDYGMVSCHPTPRDADGFWQRVPQGVGRATGTDQHLGRQMFTIMTDAGLSAIAVQYVVVDTLRVPRETFARIWEAWRDGYTDVISQGNGMRREDVLQWWSELIACVRDPRGYAVWQLPVWTATR